MFSSSLQHIRELQQTNRHVNVLLWKDRILKRFHLFLHEERVLQSRLAGNSSIRIVLQEFGQQVRPG